MTTLEQVDMERPVLCRTCGGCAVFRSVAGYVCLGCEYMEGNCECVEWAHEEALTEDGARLAVPSGDVAEDEKELKSIIDDQCFTGGLRARKAEAALSRLVARLQRAEQEEQRLIGLVQLANQKGLEDHERIEAAEANMERLGEEANRQAQRAQAAASGAALSAHADKTAGAPLGPFEEMANTLDTALRTPLCTCDRLGIHGSHYAGCPVVRGVVPALKRYPCSPTCTHDDAATPGHPERVKERSEAFKEQAVDDGEPTFKASKVNEWLAAEHDKGAEAMRSACWEALQRVAEVLALGPTEREMFKAAIEGAAP